jgi:hypothetical protein
VRYVNDHTDMSVEALDVHLEVMGAMSTAPARAVARRWWAR